MYSAAQLKAGLIGLVGWRQNYDPSGVKLYALTASESGLYFNDEHPLLNIENLLSIAPEFDKLTYPAWSGVTAYAIGDIVTLSGTKYRATAASTNQTPPNAAYWEAYYPFTAWLKEKTEAGIIRAVQAWANRKFERKTARNLLERNLLFSGAVRAQNKDANSGRIVGIEVVPARSRGVSFTIERLGLQFDTNQDITVYLFHSEDTAPEQSKTITYAAGGGLQWESVGWTLSGQGAYYVVYDMAAIAGQPINGVYDYSAAWQQYGHYPAGRWYMATGMEVTDSAASTAALWDIAQASYTVGTNYGLNLDINAGCDYTSLIIEQKGLFSELISKQVAVDLLRELAFNPTSRINRHEANVDKATLLFEIEGDSQGRPGGLRKQLDDAIESLQMDTSGIDPVCLPCRKTEAVWTVV